MTVTNPQLIKIWNSIHYLSQKETNAQQAVGKNFRKIKPLVIEAEASKTDICNALGEKDEAGKLKTHVVNGLVALHFDDPEKEKTCVEAMAEWEKEKVEVEFHSIDEKKLLGTELAYGSISVLYEYGIIIEEPTTDK